MFVAMAVNGITRSRSGLYRNGQHYTDDQTNLHAPQEKIWKEIEHHEIVSILSRYVQVKRN